MKKFIILSISILSSGLVFSQIKKYDFKTQKPEPKITTTVVGFESKQDFFRRMKSKNHTTLVPTKYYAKNRLSN